MDQARGVQVVHACKGRPLALHKPQCSGGVNVAPCAACSDAMSAPSQARVQPGHAHALFGSVICSSPADALVQLQSRQTSQIFMLFTGLAGSEQVWHEPLTKYDGVHVITGR